MKKHIKANKNISDRALPTKSGVLVYKSRTNHRSSLSEFSDDEILAEFTRRKLIEPGELVSI